MNQDAINRVAQNLPQHVLNSLSQVASRTPHRHPPHTPVSIALAGYGGVHTYPNTSYTPSGQTRFMTSYQTPHRAQPTPRYGQQTPNQNHHHQQGQFVQPAPPRSTGIHYRSTPSYPQPTPSTPAASKESTDWKKAAEAWAAQLQKPSSRSSSGTGRHDDSRRTPRSGYENSMGRETPRTK